MAVVPNEDTDVVQVVVPVSGASLDAVERLVYRARAEHADVVELRLDRCAAAGAPILVTNRHADEGGSWPGNEPDRFAALIAADAAGAAYIDCELAHLDALPRRPEQARLVLSTHDFAGMGGDLVETVRRMKAAGAAIAKIAVTVGDAADLDILADLCARFGRFASTADRTDLIAIGMGDEGLPSRLLAGAWGQAMTFGRLAIDATGSAPGQPTVRELDKHYRVRSQGADTCIFGAVGDPVDRHLAPLLHNAAFAHHGIDAVSVPFLAHDATRFWRSCGNWIDGLAVADPHQAALVATMDDIEDLAVAVGAINTVYRDDDGRCIGANTDAPAAVNCLEEASGDLTGKRVLLIGATDVARPIAFALHRAGAAVTITAEDPDQAGDLATAVGCTTIGWEQSVDHPYDILANATTIGTNDPDTSPWPAESHRPGSVVFDTVSSPLETRLLREAAAAEAVTINGLALLERQAAGQYQAWTGIAPPQALFHRRALEALGTAWTEQVTRERDG